MGTKKVVDVNGAGMDKYIKDITKIVEKVDPKSINEESGGKDGANKKPTPTTPVTSPTKVPTPTTPVTTPTKVPTPTTTGTTTKKKEDPMDKYIKDITKITDKIDPKSTKVPTNTKKAPVNDTKAPLVIESQDKMTKVEAQNKMK